MGGKLLKQDVTISGPAGSLEGRIARSAAGTPRFLALICHPHPLHGGTMDNKVVTTLARGFGELGALTLRFNFRGVGKSAGEFDAGVGEVDDAAAAAAWLRSEWPHVPLILAGFSFGAMVALRAAARLRPLALTTVALPVQRLEAMEPRLGLRWLLIHGSKDELIPVDRVSAWIERIDPTAELHVLRPADHFFHGKLTELKAIVLEYFDKLLAETGFPVAQEKD